MGTHLELGHALITMVEPHQNSIVTYNGDSPIGQVVTLRPIVLPKPLPAMPGVIIGGDPSRNLHAHCCFVDGDAGEPWPTLTARISRALGHPGAAPLLVAPFVPTVPGTDRYLDELW